MIFDFPQIDPVALALGPLQIRWYALAYLAGFLIGWRYCLSLVSNDPAIRPNRDDIDDVLTWIIIGVILGGRLGYVLFYNFDYYAVHPIDALKIWHGGMSFHGGVLGVMAAMFAYELVHKVCVLRLADVVCAAAPIGLFFGRIANFINAELVGRYTGGNYGIIFPGDTAPRHPSQLYEALLEGLVLFLIIFAMTRIVSIKEKPGIIAGAFLIGYGVFRAIIEFFREPDAQIGLYFNTISQGQLLSLPMVVIGVLLIIRAFYVSKPKGE